MARQTITVVPATPARWADLEVLFGPKGACSGCWCMFWRQTNAMARGKGPAENKANLQALVAVGEKLGQAPGLLAYADGAPAGWVAVGPRSAFARLGTSRKLAAIDDRPVWSVTCFFVGKGHRRQGLMRALLDGAVDYAREHGATIVEAYPLDLDSAPLSGRHLNGDGGYMGVASVFEAAGFKLAKQVGETQLLMRRALRPKRA